MPIPSTNRRNNCNIRLLFALVWLFSSLSVGAANAGPTSSSSSLTTLIDSDTVASRAKEDQIIASYGHSLGGKRGDRWRRDLPPELRSERGAPLHRIEMDGVVIYLLGTSHVSRASCDDARLLMQHIRPGESRKDVQVLSHFYLVILLITE